MHVYITIGGTHTHLLQRPYRLLQLLLLHEQTVHRRVTDRSELLLQLLMCVHVYIIMCVY